MYLNLSLKYVLKLESIFIFSDLIYQLTALHEKIQCLFVENIVVLCPVGCVNIVVLCPVGCVKNAHFTSSP